MNYRTTLRAMWISLPAYIAGFVAMAVNPPYNVIVGTVMITFTMVRVSRILERAA